MIKKIYEKEEKGIIYRKYQSDEYVIIVRDRRTNNDQSITKLHVEVNICGTDNIIYPEIKFSKARKCFVSYPAKGIFIDDVTYEPFMNGMKVAHAFTAEANQVLVQRILDPGIPVS